MSSYEFKRGATYRLPFQITEDNGDAVDTTGWTVTSHIRRDSGDALVVECEVEEVDVTVGSYEAVVEDTSEWPFGALYTDVRALKDDGDTEISGTIAFTVVREATRS